MDLKEVRCKNVEWIQLARNWDEWLALMNMLMNFLVLQKTGTS
jgi:hypothetical protein